MIKPYDEPSEADRYQMIRTYFQMLIEEELPDAVGKMKQFASWFTHGVPGGAALRKAIYESKERGGDSRPGRRILRSAIVWRGQLLVPRDYRSQGTDVRSIAYSVLATLFHLIQNRSHDPTHHAALHSFPARLMRHKFRERMRELRDRQRLQPDSSRPGELPPEKFRRRRRSDS